MVLGVIVTDQSKGKFNDTQLALVVDREYSQPSEFQLVPVLAQRSEFSLLMTKKHKNLERNNKFNDFNDLPYGLLIEWDARVGAKALVRSMIRCRGTIFETRIVNSETQMLLTGIMSPDRQVFWMLGKMPNLKIPLKLQDSIIPNVAVKAWICVQILPNLLLKYELNEFVEYDEDFQSSVRTTMWNRNVINFRHMIADDFDNRVKTKEDPNLIQRPQNWLSGMEGVVISNRAIICPQYPFETFLDVVVGRNVTQPIGTHVMFTARWIDFHGVFSIERCNPLDPSTNAMGSTPDGYLRTTIRRIPEAPGFYKSVKLNCVVDDPENVLIAWRLSKYADSALSVAISSALPNSCGLSRYCVVKITDAKESKIKEQVGNEMKIENAECVMYDALGRLFLPEFPKIQLRLSKEDRERCDIGRVYCVTAQCDSEKMKWRIVSIKESIKYERFKCFKYFDEFMEKDNIAFYLPEVSGSQELIHYYHHPVFGLIESEPQFTPVKLSGKQKYKDIWICANSKHPGDNLQPACTFRHYKTGLEPPHESEEVLAKLIVEEKKTEKAEKIPVYQTKNNSTVKDIMKDVTVIVEKIQREDEWKKDPKSKIRKLINEHLNECIDCKNSVSGCLFPEVLGALILNTKVELMDALAETNMLTLITSRRSFMK